ncbi:MAG: phosphoribosylanthranilate isomerase [Gemmatimonadetes bacterium]|nr:phosphoribosylanthranilate isomerase [Gemmatimonadota bacterium]
MKICGLTANEDAVAAARLGADYLGVVLTPGFRRSVPVASAAAVVDGTRTWKVAVLVNPSGAEADEAATALGASVVQLHGDEGPDLVRELRRRGEWWVWKAVRARTSSDIRRTVDTLGPLVDGILVEGWKEGVVGGGGVRVMLEPEAVREAVPPELQLILAGGLTPSTAASAVARFRPDVVDVSSGVEGEQGRKDPKLMGAFVQAARPASTT